MNKRLAHTLNVLVLLVMSIIYVAPLLSAPPDLMYDWPFHSSRIIGLDNVFKSPVSFTGFGQHGNIVNEFYPWLTLYPVYLLFKLSGDGVTTYQAFLFGNTMITALVAYYSAYRIKGDRYLAVIFGLTYTYSGYRLANILDTGDMGIIISITFLPLVLLGCYEVFVGDYQRWYYLTIGMSLLVYTHALSSVITVGFIFLALIISFYSWDDKKKRLIAFSFATGMSVLLCLAYLYPLLQQVIAQPLIFPAPKELIGVTLKEFVSAQFTYQTFIGNIVGAITFISFFVALFLHKRLNNVERFIFGIGAFALLSVTAVFPWGIFGGTFFKVVQWPGRFIIIAVPCLLYAFSAAVSASAKQFNIKVNYIMLGVLGVILIIANNFAIKDLYNQDPHNHKEIKSYNQVNVNFLDYGSKGKVAITSQWLAQKNYYFNDEMLHTNVIQKATNTTKTQHKTKPTSAVYLTATHDASNFEITVTNNTKHRAELITPVFRYIGQEVRINNVSTTSTLSKYGTTQITVPPGKSTIKISYHYTKLARFAQITSLLVLFWFLLFTFVVSSTLKSNKVS
ncbi:MAG: hypothetical protein QM613_05030 [Micrococcaceae bacterium]